MRSINLVLLFEQISAPVGAEINQDQTGRYLRYETLIPRAVR